MTTMMMMNSTNDDGSIISFDRGVNSKNTLQVSVAINNIQQRRRRLRKKRYHSHSIMITNMSIIVVLISIITSSWHQQNYPTILYYVNSLSTTSTFTPKMRSSMTTQISILKGTSLKTRPNNKHKLSMQLGGAGGGFKSSRQSGGTPSFGSATPAAPPGGGGGFGGTSFGSAPPGG